MLSLPVRANASVPTPLPGYSTVYFSLELNTPAYKDDAGAVHPLTGLTGPQGPKGPPVSFLLDADVSEPLMIPGRRGTSSGGAGGTILYDHHDSLAPDAPTLAYEFNTSDLSAFTIVNNRGTVDANTQARNKLVLSLPTQDYKYVALLLPLPGDTNYTIHSIIDVAGRPLSTLVAGGGIVLSDTNTTNTGKQTGVAFGSVELDAPPRITSTWDGFGQTTSGAGFPTRDVMGGHRCHLRLRKQGGSYFAAWGGSGTGWHEVALSIWGGVTPAYFGLYGQNYTGHDAQIEFEYLRYYNNGTQMNTGTNQNVLG